MNNLIKMDLRRLFRSPMFIVSMSVVALINILLRIGFQFLLSILVTSSIVQDVSLSDLIVNPFYVPLLIIVLFSSVINFSYADIADGYVKNIVGQVPRKSYLVFSKTIVIAIHNTVFLAVGIISNIIGAYISSVFGKINIVADSEILSGLGTLLIKWLLCLALCSILVFITTGIKNKSLATVMGVLFGVDALSLIYLAIDLAIENLFKIKDFSFAELMPDYLYSTVDVASDNLVINGIIVAVIFFVGFFALTIRTFNSRDIK